MADSEYPLVMLIPGKAPVVPSGSITEVEYEDLLAEWAAMQAAFADLDLDTLSDVDTSAKADGYVLTWDDDTDTWIAAAAVAPFTFSDTASIDLVTTGSVITANAIFGGTGAASTIARSDHTHSAPKGKRATFAATGVLSSGTRTLVTTTFGPLTSGITYDIAASFLVRARNNINSGTFNLLCRIGADAAYPQLSRNVQTVGGVPVDQPIDFGDANGDMVAVGAGATLAISFQAQFSTGDPVDLRDGYYRVMAYPRS